MIRDADRSNIYSNRARARRVVGEGARRKTDGGRDAGRLLHGLEPGRNRRHGVHAHHQCARGCDPRRSRVRAKSRSSTKARSCRGSCCRCRCPTITGSSTARKPRASSCFLSKTLSDVEGAACERRRGPGSRSRRCEGRRRWSRCSCAVGAADPRRRSARHARDREGVHGRALAGGGRDRIDRAQEGRRGGRPAR